MELIKEPAVVSTRWMVLPDIDSPQDFRACVMVREVWDGANQLQLVVEETIAFWYRTARLIASGVFEEEAERWAKRNHELSAAMYHNLPVVTVYGDVKTNDNREVSITMTEYGTVQAALMLAKAALDAENTVRSMIKANTKAEARKSAANTPAPAPQQPAPTTQQPTQTPPQNVEPGERILGVVKEIKVVKIGHKFSDDGVRYFGLFGQLGNGKIMQYPFVRFYTDEKGEKNFNVVKDSLPELTPGTEITGEWRYTANVVERTENGKTTTYYNPIKLERVR